MPEVIFWDTAAFVALANRDDMLHDAAILVSQRLARASARLVTTDAVLTEVANTFSRATLRSMARQVIDAYQSSVRIRAAYVLRS